MSKKLKVLLVIIAVIGVFYSVLYHYNSLRSFTVVIARYNENLDWVVREFPNQNVIIYNKGDEDIKALPNWKIIKLPNIGRESHTYLYHLVTNYHNLADRTLFLQGYPYDHHEIYTPMLKYKNKIFPHFANKCKNIIARCGDSFSAYIKSFYKRASDRLDDQSAELEKSQHASFRKGVEKDNLENFISLVLDKKLPSDTVIGWVFGAQFAVDREVVLRHNIKYYQRLLNIFSENNQEEGYFFEKSWDIIFDNGNYKESIK